MLKAHWGGPKLRHWRTEWQCNRCRCQRRSTSDNRGAEAQGGAQQQQSDPGGANAANDEHNVTKNPNALTPGEYVIHREASWDYVDTTGSRYHVDGDGGWTSVGEDGTSTVAADGSWTKNYADGHTVARVEADGTYRVTYDGQLSPEMPSNAVPVSPGKLPDRRRSRQ